MSTMSIKQELLHEVYHDHTHFERMFADLSETFKAVLTNELELQERPDLVKTAVEDVSFLVEEMIEHIAIEEEAVFTILSESYPQFADRIHRFQGSHDNICAKLSQIKSVIVDGDVEQMENSALKIYEAIQEAHEIVERHGREENTLFDEALAVMSQEDCERLLAALREG